MYNILTTEMILLNENGNARREQITGKERTTDRFSKAARRWVVDGCPASQSQPSLWLDFYILITNAVPQRGFLFVTQFLRLCESAWWMSELWHCCVCDQTLHTYIL